MKCQTISKIDSAKYFEPSSIALKTSGDSPIELLIFQQTAFL